MGTQKNNLDGTAGANRRAWVCHLLITSIFPDLKKRHACFFLKISSNFALRLGSRYNAPRTLTTPQLTHDAVICWVVDSDAVASSLIFMCCVS